MNSEQVGQGAGRYRIQFAARSSPAGVATGAIFSQFAPLGSKIMGPPPIESLSSSS
eukprot:COSAG02_NODE_51837_length_311_cov_1.221698_1_plen_55_part_01